jgi:formylglycine-generating enzyme required for sulfatase activity
MPRISIAALLTIFLVSLTACSGSPEEPLYEAAGESDTETLQPLKDPEMVLIPAGSFMMGNPSGEGEGNEHPQHKVSVDSFYMGKYEVTFEQYDIFCQQTGRSTPSNSGWGRGNRPVINVSWNDAVAFCDWLSKMTGKKYRLPTEAEWEYACRAGTNSKYSFGNSTGDLGLYGWYDGNSGGKTHPVGSLRPNPWGLHDMHGNVFEWCSDWYGSNYYSSSPSRNPKGPSCDSRRFVAQ